MFPPIITLASLLFFSPLLPQTQTTLPAVPAEDAKMTNPVKSTVENQAKARKMYGYDCAMCHGKDGRGDGELGVSMKLKLADFTDAAFLKTSTDGEMYYIMKNGRGQMPAEGERSKPDDLWNMVSYIRSMAVPAHAATPVPVAMIDQPLR